MVRFAPERRSRYWLCICECGSERTVFRSNLVTGRSKSCGCFNLEKVKEGRKHGMAGSPEAKAWGAMKQRCLNPNNPKYASYGGRGITVCDRWRESFESFYEDMGARPSPEHSIDRVDNDGPYSPENCRWATRTEQARNQGTNRPISFRGETLCLSEWAERTGLQYDTLKARLQYGWTVEDALTRPLRVWGS